MVCVPATIVDRQQVHFAKAGPEYRRRIESALLRTARADAAAALAWTNGPPSRKGIVAETARAASLSSRRAGRRCARLPRRARKEGAGYAPAIRMATERRTSSSQRPSGLRKMSSGSPFITYQAPC